MSGGGALVLTALAGCGSLPRQGPGGGASTASRQTMDGIRTAEGLALISPDHQLEQAALQQAQYMAASGRMNHTTGFGKDFQARVKSNGIRGAAAENIAEGRMDAARAIDMWMNSPPHRRNMLRPSLGNAAGTAGMALLGHDSGKLTETALSCSQRNGSRFLTPSGGLTISWLVSTLRKRVLTGPVKPDGGILSHHCDRGNQMAKTKFRPLHDRVVVRRVESEEKTAGGIIIPDTAKEKPQEGEVVAVGSGARDESGKLVALDVKAGDRVLFGKWSGTEVKLNGEDLLIMKESDIMGIIG
jgi:chaperonin GroES